MNVRARFLLSTCFLFTTVWLSVFFFCCLLLLLPSHVLMLRFCLLLRLAVLAVLVDADSYVASNSGRFLLTYKQANYDKCFAAWQRRCWHHWTGDANALLRICNASLDRPHLRSHLTLPAADVRQMMETHMERHWTNNAMPRLFVPRFTALGWKRVSVPRYLHEPVAQWYESQRYRMVAEDWPSLDDVGCNNNYDNDDFLIPHDEAAPVMALGNWIREQLQQWTGMEVDPTWKTYYGARLQHRGSTCALHVDATETHVMSATYNIAQKGLKGAWPLAFVEPGGHVEQAVQQPGDVVFYEGASGMHGRPRPLDGEEFVSIYFHWRPKDWKARLQKSLPRSHFEELVEVRESAKAPANPPRRSARVLEDGRCPAEGEDTHAAARISDLWRGAHTYPRHIFDGSRLTEEDVLRRMPSESADGTSLDREARELAARLVRTLGLFDYVALHARALDPRTAVEPGAVLARWVGFLQPGTTLYVAGDGAGRYRAESLGERLNITVLTWGALAGSDGHRDRDEVVEELICAHARLFIASGDPASLFSQRVQRSRVLTGAPSTWPLRHQDSVAAALDTLNADEVGRELLAWRQAAAGSRLGRTAKLRHGAAAAELFATARRSAVGGCHALKTEGDCVASVDGRPLADLGGFRVRHEPCVWCCGKPCIGGTENLCEPRDWLIGSPGVVSTLVSVLEDTCHPPVDDEEDAAPWELQFGPLCLSLLGFGLAMWGCRWTLARRLPRAWRKFGKRAKR
eukprot:TRINITY_DN6222_c1_g2_i1.p1 TRINITY_DN6222_c1_g2~~TRINITY_DN6222_c1_g2_i1.p1  ORF type:complete len:744 (-),score=142.00 TRINITY_DN6222_c1_g2_i1:141-2372(-)